MKKKLLWIPLAVVVIFSVTFGIYVSAYYHANEVAVSALASDESVQVFETDYGWLFDGPCTDAALIFYPGAKVETTAYAPFLHLLAAQGMDVCLVDMPFHLAFFGINTAEEVMAEYEYENWYIGGHSLGGAMAASFAADHGDALSGVVLCAAYPTKTLDANMTEVLIYGSEDHVVSLEKIKEGAQYAPNDLTETVIQGGNHAQFGNYGFQKGDGEASISAVQQQEEAVEIIVKSIHP